ncbi:MAG: trimethylamine methyltransferase family protein [Planctomycetota bacterium]
MQMVLGYDGIKVLQEDDIKSILDAAFKILEKTGVVVENDEILERLREYGGQVNVKEQKVRFGKSFVESFINTLQKEDWKAKPIKISAAVEIHNGYYLDPVDDCFKEWTRERFLDYVKVGKNLKNIDNVYMLGCPLKEVEPGLRPLYEKLYCWKYGVEGGEAIWDTKLCPKIYEMWQVYAGETGRDLKELYNGKVYLIPPLRLGKEEAEQFMYFHRKGLYTKVGTMGSLGGTVPVTLAGGLALQLAEGLFISMLQDAFLGSKRFEVFNVLTVLDMSTGASQFGRPERNMLNVAGAQIAKYLGLDFFGHCGLSDAKVPGSEAAFQKVSSVIFNALACGKANLVAGLLGVDEVFSPVQMILEDEMIDALKWAFKGFQVNEQTLALDVIDEQGPGGNFLSTEHTLLNFRQALWQPALSSKEMFAMWKDRGMKSDIVKAKEKFLDILQNGKPLEPQISERAERELLKIINK